MFDLHSLLLFVIAGLVLNFTPGPDVLYITARALSQGWRAGAASALGINAGCLVHTAAAAFGISVLLRASPLAYDVLRYAGAAYLVWLGLQALIARSATTTIAQLAPTPMRNIFAQGFVTNVLNPKVALFFLAFLPQFADPARGSFTLQVILLGLIFIANGLWVCLLYAYAASAAALWLKRRGGSVAWVRRFSGGVLVALGLHLALNRPR